MDKKNEITIVIHGGDEKKPITKSKIVVAVDGRSIDQKSVDLVFVIDTTGSMSDKIEGLLQTCSKFVDEFSQLKVDYRIAVVAFGDLTVPGDTIESTNFMKDIGLIKKSLKEISRNGGGGNEGESSLEAVRKAMSFNFRSKTVKMLILITDEPALQRELTADIVINELAKHEFLTFVISPPLKYYKSMAAQTGGNWYQVSSDTDFTDLLEMFKKIANKVTEVLKDVYRLGDGSVAAYLRLNPPKE